MGDDSGVAIALSELNGTEGLGKRANLVNLNKDRVGAAERSEERRVGKECL